MSKIWYILILVFCSFLGRTQVSPFDCTGDFYAFTSANTLINLGTPQQGQSQISGTFPFELDVLEYHTRDNFMYGFSNSTHHLYRIGKNGTYEDLGIPPNLEYDIYNFQGGFIPPNGGVIVLFGQDNVSQDRVVTRINLSPPHQAGNLPVSSTGATTITSGAFDPYFGIGLGWDQKNRRLSTINSNGSITFHDYQNESQNFQVKLGFDRAGQLWGLENTVNWHQLNKFNGRLIETRPTDITIEGSVKDICNCPYQLMAYRDQTKDTLLPCEVYEVAYTFSNTAGMSVGPSVLRDTFPVGTIILEIIGINGIQNVVSGIGTNILEVENTYLYLLDENLLTLKVQAPPYAGNYSNLSYSGPYAPAYGPTLISDDLDTSSPNDANNWIVDTQQVITFHEQTICPNQPITLSAPSEGFTYKWNSGDTTSTIQAGSSGTYWVLATNICGSYADTTTLELAPNWFTGIELLNATNGNNAQNISNYKLEVGSFLSVPPVGEVFWSKNGQGRFSCDNCPLTEFNLESSQWIYLYTTDVFGCSYQDSVYLDLNQERKPYWPNIFSPNGDNVNDTWSIEGNLFKVQKIRVFDRWGGIIFDETAEKWGGTTYGNAAPSGTYLIEIVLEDILQGTTQILRKDVTLVR